jgi:hypothetical protein
MSSIPETNEEIDSFECVAKDEFIWKQNWISPTREVSQDDILKSPYSDDTKLALFSEQHCGNIRFNFDMITVSPNKFCVFSLFLFKH